MAAEGTEQQAFEQQRLAWFAEQGVAGEVRRLGDPDGRETWALDTGGAGIPTVLVHGGLAEASVWSLVAGRLPGRVVIVDRPGCGLSTPMDYRGSAYRAEAVAWLGGVVDALGTPQVHLVGNSMGGYFCLAFALAHPERVARLVLPGAPAGLDRRLPVFLRLWGTSLLGRLISKMSFPDVETFRKRVWRDLVAHPERLPVGFLEVALAGGGLPGVMLTSRTMLGAVTDLGGWRPHLLLRDEVASLRVPTRFIWGAEDAFASPDSGRDLVARMPDADLVVLDDAGHMPQLERPEAVAEATATFLTRTSVG